MFSLIQNDILFMVRCENLKNISLKQKNIFISKFFLLSFSRRSKAVPKTKCSSRCGQGMQKIHYLCYKISKNSEKSVDTRYCNPYRAPYMSNCRGRCLGLQWKYSKWGQVIIRCVKLVGKVRKQN